MVVIINPDKGRYMSSVIQTVNEHEFEKTVGKRPFVALPQEEIDRLYGAIEVFPVHQNEVAVKSGGIPLCLFVVAHHNYTWMTCKKKGRNTLSLGFSGWLLSQPNGDIFLDESIAAQAGSIFDAHVRSKGPYDVRIAGLMYDASTKFGSPRLGITCICRLRQPDRVEPVKDDLEIGRMGNGELLQKQNLFDDWSRIVIGNSVAL
jgi:hypothetical protein